MTSSAPLNNMSAAARLAAIVEASDDAIVSTTLAGVITSWNRAAERMFGYTAGEALGAHLTLIIPEDRRAEADMILGRVRGGGTLDHVETVRRARDGRLLNVSLTVSPLRDAGGHVVGASEIARDLSERLRSDEARARLAAIVESSDDAIVSKTIGGVITSWNEAAERIFGYTAAEAVGRHITLIVPDDRRAEEEDVLTRIRAGQRVAHFDTVRVTKSGERIDVSLTVSPVRSAAGEVIGASKIARDVSDRKRLERARAELLADAQAANRAKDDFLAMLGHELRNPLAAIASAASVLGIARTLDDVARPRAVVERQVKHLKRLVDDLLDTARVRAAKVRLHTQLVDLADAVEHAVGVLGGAAVPAQHVIEVDTDRVGVQADPVRLEQIILTLLTNAVKYTPAGRRIRVTTRAEEGDAVLRVEDEGVGIAPEALSSVFDLFVQGARSADRAQGGLGIGLTLVRALVELHGGTVVAASNGPGLGSVFTVRLPRAPLPAAEGGEATRRPTAARRVLIVEDNDDAREMLKIFLQVHGHEVFEAANGAEGVRQALQLRPELALVDLGLPVLDGFEVARQIRRQMPRTPRLVALTGYGEREDRERCLQAGFDEHLVKPVDPARLAEILNRVP